MKKMKLYAVKTWGSTIIELVLGHADLPCEIEYMDADNVRTDAFRKINPLTQIPTLVLASGEIMTESLAIALYLNAIGGASLVPKVDDPTYPVFLRWSVFLSASIYSTAPFADHPDWFVKDKTAQIQLRDETMARVKDRFLLLEKNTKAPYFLGDKLSLIDLYLTVMSYWEPRREWFDSHCPKLMANVTHYQTTPVFQEVYKRNAP